ncbi:MAG TPA: trehalose-phosphatase [Actinomycetota bacterium]|nr:trehalose-phosphatase [Actinomycetota bacterium]
MDTAIGAIRADPERAGIFLDFDGTLSEIVTVPDAARAARGVSEVLPVLAARYRVVAIVSGRQAADVAARLEIEEASLVRCYGLYGLELFGAPALLDAPLVDRVAEAMPDVERAASYVPGALVEHKGLHVAVHYRSAPDAEAARRVLLERLSRTAAEVGLRLLEGKRVVELAPGAGPTKGDVVRSVASSEDLAAVLYAGDDVADLDAFATLDALRERGVTTTKVAVRSAETPESVVAAADVVVDAPPGLVAFLGRRSA